MSDVECAREITREYVVGTVAVLCTCDRLHAWGTCKSCLTSRTWEAYVNQLEEKLRIVELSQLARNLRQCPCAVPLCLSCKEWIAAYDKLNVPPVPVEQLR